MNRMVCAADVTRQECFEHLDEYIRNSGHDLDDYDMLFQLTLPVWGATENEI